MCSFTPPLINVLLYALLFMCSLLVDILNVLSLYKENTFNTHRNTHRNTHSILDNTFFLQTPPLDEINIGTHIVAGNTHRNTYEHT